MLNTNYPFKISKTILRLMIKPRQIKNPFSSPTRLIFFNSFVKKIVVEFDTQNSTEINAPAPDSNLH